MRTLVNREIGDKTEQVCEQYCFKCHPNEHNDEEASHEKEGLSVQQFEAWIEHFENEPFIAKQREAMLKLDADLFERQRIDHLTFEEAIPEDLTADKYLLMYKKIWAVIRHNLYKAIVNRKKELRVTELEASEFDKLYNEVHKKFESVRTEVYY